MNLFANELESRCQGKVHEVKKDILHDLTLVFCQFYSRDLLSRGNMGHDTLTHLTEICGDGFEFDFASVETRIIDYTASSG